MAAGGLFSVPVLARAVFSLLLLAHLALSYTPLSDSGLRAIPSGGSDFDIHTGALLSPILIPRVPGTPGSAKVQEHFVTFFRTHLPLWTIEWHNSTSTTPATGSTKVPFVNLIFRRDPPWAGIGDVGRLTLAAHYDSKYHPDGFIGATDSAAPCAMLMHVARSVDAALTRKWEGMLAAGYEADGLEEERGVQIAFIDGEEAWVSWTDEDSLYGSRALASTWESTLHPSSSLYRNPLRSISLFLLLDLLGDANPRVPSYFPNTHWAYQHLTTVEDRLRTLGLLETGPQTQFLPDKDRAASEFRWRGSIADDHVPFMERGVDVLHVIPMPFPGHWHTMGDNAEALDLPTVRDWGKIFTAFVAEWMELEGEMAVAGENRESYGKDEL